MRTQFARLMVVFVVFATGLTVRPASGDLAAYWKFDEASGTAAFDCSGNGYDAKVCGAIRTSKGYFGGALNFGNEEYLSIPAGVLSSISKQMTISFWYYGKSVGRFPRTDHILSAWNERQRILSIHLPWRDNKVYWETGSGWVPGHAWVDGKLIRSDYVSKSAEAEEHQDCWNHWVFIKNADTGEMKIYLNGALWCSGFDRRQRISEVTSFNFGLNRSDTPPDGFDGLLDDVAIFDHALGETEVAQLYSLGAASFIPVPESLQVLGEAVQRAEAIIKGNKPQEAIGFLQGKIMECKQWRQENPNGAESDYRMLSHDLYSLLAKAKEATGAPQDEIAEAYKHAIESGLLSSAKQARTLLWLYENVKTGAYEKIVHFLLENNSDWAGEVAAQAEAMARKQKSKAAIRFLELHLDAYERWRQKHPLEETIVEDRLPGIYFQLARTKETAGAPRRDIANAYSKTFSSSRFDYTPQQTTALVWLLQNEFTSEYTTITNSLTQDFDSKGPFANVVSNTCKYFELEKDWAQFEGFLDTLFVQAKNPFDWARLVESCLNDRTNRWAEEYYKYLENRPKLRFGWDWIAEQHIASGDFEKAAQAYQDIIETDGEGQNRSTLQLRLCRCLFYGGEYVKAISALEGFIADNKVINRDAVKEAMLMKGRAHLHLCQLDEAKEEFVALMSGYPELRNSAEANFYTGYCLMKQGKFEAAAGIFDGIIRDHPDDLYARKARMCKTHIRNVIQ